MVKLVRLLLVLVFAMAAVATVFAKDYTVGDSQGWSTGVDYGTWASSNTLKVGDTLLFTYGGLHSVDEVSKSDYESCSSSNAIHTNTDGNTKVTLTAPGSRYFICGTAGHCGEGMKLAVTVTAAGSGSGSPPTAGGSGSGSPPTSGGSGSGSPPTSTTSPATPAGGKSAAGKIGFCGGDAAVILGLIGLGLFAVMG